MSLVLILKFIHVVAAIVAVGSNFTYVYWQRAAERDPDRLLYTLRAVRRLDNLVATPAYVVVVLAGMSMVAFGGYPADAGWILTSFFLFIGIVVFGGAFYGPALKRQIREAEADPSTDAYTRAAARANAFGYALLAAVLVIVFLMVTKPF